MMRALGYAIILLLAGALSEPASASFINTVGAFDFTFYNTGETNGVDPYVGAGDWTQEHVDAVLASASTWNAGITSTPARQVRVEMFWGELASALGGAFSPIYGDGSDAFTLGEHAWRDGGTYTGSTPYDTLILYDMTPVGGTYTWNFGTGAPTSSQFDFQSVVTHEIGHSLGWGGTYTSASDTWWPGGTTAWDKNLRDSAGNTPAVGSTGTPGNFNELDNPVYFVGSNAVALYGGPVPVYAPAAYASGSSLAHLDTSTFPEYVMAHAIANGVQKRDLSPLEWAMMVDMGWSVEPELWGATPEPSALLLVGSGLLLIRRRRRRRGR
jgi:hypothetical protein